MSLVLKLNKNMLQRRRTEKLIRVKNSDRAQKKILMLMQEKAFKQEVKLLASKQITPQSSSIYKLNPYFDDDC